MRLVPLICGKNHTFDAWAEGKDYPECPECGEMSNWNPLGANIYIDAFTPVYSDALGDWVSSNRERTLRMAKLGYVPVGDPVGGKRPDHTLKDRAMSYSGQASRHSSGERKADRERQLRRERRQRGFRA